MDNKVVGKIVPGDGHDSIAVRTRADGMLEIRQGAYIQVLDRSEVEGLMAAIEGQRPTRWDRIRFLWEDFCAGVQGRTPVKRFVTLARDEAE